MLFASIIFEGIVVAERHCQDPSMTKEKIQEWAAKLVKKNKWDGSSECPWRQPKPPAEVKIVDLSGILTF